MIYLVSSVETGATLFWTDAAAYEVDGQVMVDGARLMLGTRDKTPIRKPTKVVPLIQLRPDEASHEATWQAVKRMSPIVARPGFYFSEQFMVFFLSSFALGQQTEDAKIAAIRFYALGFEE